MSSSNKAVASSLLLLILSLLYFWPFLSGGYIFSERDLSVFFIPPKTLWIETLKNGEVPLWNPYWYSGHPLLATLQPGVFYPINLLFFILPFDIAWNYHIIIHYFLAGVFTLLLMRWLGASYHASLIGAISFMLSGYLLSVHNVPSTLFSVTWAPLIILLYLKAFPSPAPPPYPGGSTPVKGEGTKGGGKGRPIFVVLSGIVTAISFCGGGVETVYLTIGFIFIITFVPHLLKEGLPSPSIGQIISYPLIFLLIFFVAGAVQILPFIELVGQSVRGGGIGYDMATLWSLDLKDITGFFIPHIYDYWATEESYWGNQSWLKIIYLGGIPLILSLFFFVERKGKALVYGFIILLAFALALGKNMAIYPFLFKYLPFFDRIRYPVKFLFLSILFISITSGLGYDSLLRGIERERWMKGMLFFIFGLAVLSVLLLGVLDAFEGDVRAFLEGKGLKPPTYTDIGVTIFNTKRFLFIFTILGLVLNLGLRTSLGRRLLPFTLVTLLTIDLFFAGYGFYQRIRGDLYHREAETMKFILGDKSLSRIFVTPNTAKSNILMFLPSMDKSYLTDTTVLTLALVKEKVSMFNLERHIFDVDGYDVLRQKDYDNVLSLIKTAPTPDSTNLLALLNVKYVLSVPKIESPEFRLARVFLADPQKDQNELEGEGYLKIYENMNYLPRAFLVDRYRVVTKEEDYRDIMASKEWRPGEEVLLYEEPWGKKGSGVRGQGSGLKRQEGRVEVIEYKSNRVRLEVVSDSPKILVMSDVYYPGWKVYVNGEEGRILKADYAFRAVPLERGRYVVEFVYDPWTFKAGLLITLITIVSLAGMGIMVWWRRNHGEPI